MTQWCADIYGPEFSPAVIENSIQNTNTDFGGYSYQGTNVMFVNGKIDPWHIISIFEEKPNPETNIIYSEEFAHCAEMRATRPSDTQQMLDVRARIVSFIESILENKTIIATTTTGQINSAKTQGCSIIVLILSIFSIISIY
jgi:hypothetical protein